MKHVGLNVAADALMTLAYVGVKGGMVIVSADDPSLFSSQNEQDNRYYAKMAGLPMLEPATPEEAKEMTRAAFALSEELASRVSLRTTTRVNHTRGPVTLGELAARPGPGRFYKDPFRQVMVPAVARQAHMRLLAAQDQARALAETSSFNEISGRGIWGHPSPAAWPAPMWRTPSRNWAWPKKCGCSSWDSPTPCPRPCWEIFWRRWKVLVVEELEPTWKRVSRPWPRPGGSA